MLEGYNAMNQMQQAIQQESQMEPKVTNLVESNPLAVFKAVKDFMFTNHH